MGAGLRAQQRRHARTCFPPHCPAARVAQNGAFFVDMFLRTLNAIHEDIVSAEGSGYSPEVRPAERRHHH